MTGARGLAGLTSVLDEEHSAVVRRLWSILEDEFGLRNVTISPLPHLTYQASRVYDLDVLNGVARDLAGMARPLKVTTTGIGVFNGPSPVVYLPVVRTPELTRFQLAAWSAGCLATESPDPYFHPSSWVPHLTLAQGDVSPQKLSAIVGRLNAEDLNLEMVLDNVSVIQARGYGKPQELVARYELTGTARNF